MAAFNPPKSILKKPTYPATAPKSKEEHDREVALYHANLIQQRKDLELDILCNQETLIDYPLARFPYTASNPSIEDARTFKELLRPFQPSDYDALILERNIVDNCGYALCPNKRVKDGGGGLYRLVGTSGKARDFRVVAREETEKWCSEACARRALYIRVQLSERPAWERGADIESSIDLLDEPKSEDETVFDGLNNLSLGENSGGQGQGAANLALERGDRGVYGSRNGLVDVRIQENDIRGPVRPPTFEDGLTESMETMHLSLEGYTTKFGSAQQEDDMDLWGE